MHRHIALAIAAAGAALAVVSATSPASAWVAYHGGGVWRGPAGGFHAWHGGAAWGGPVVRPGWGYGWGYGGPSPGAAAAVGAAAGLAAGAALGAAAAAPPPVYYAPPPVTTSAPIGAMFASLPGGCTSATVSGVRYYRCGSTFYRPYYSNGRAVYQVVANPF
ncbi:MULTISPECIES: DUF6515 family protein [unclassified Chelatococcus]|uniref:DUF6515 family protein n=1 Tax=unclassified Chelatococcus TaxID=2638111 RepID=UPI001BCC69D3|nr:MULTISPECIES: DUF6515 family protein [unclassified Chelatococcus]MBS7696882.1 hypothetical protein [Chelatococcus sp. YT9]MBX3558280.1 hypothetical protein [Chelatococcus sp.]